MQSTHKKTEKSVKCGGSAKNVAFHFIHGHETSHLWTILELSIYVLLNFHLSICNILGENHISTLCCKIRAQCKKWLCWLLSSQWDCWESTYEQQKCT